MAFPKSRSKILGLVLVIIVAGAAGYIAFGRPSNSNAPTADQNQAASQTPNSENSPALKPAEIDTAEFTYDKPESWAKFSSDYLATSESNSGIGYYTPPADSSTPGLPVASFTVKVNNSAPTSSTELRNATLTELNKRDDFELINSDNTTVDGKTGQKFTYRFGTSNKAKQELSVIVHNKKTYLLLVSSAEGDFDKYTGDFTKILDSFKFK